MTKGKSFVLLLLCALLAITSLDARAFSYIVDMAGAPLTPLTTLPGVRTSSGDGFFTYLAPAPAFEYFTPSVLSLGQLTTTPELAGANQSGSFNSPSDFTFLVGRGNGAGAFLFGPDVVHATADLTGMVGIDATGTASSSAQFTSGAATVESGPNAGTASKPSTDPLNDRPANELDLSYDGVPVRVWIDLIASVPAPGAAPIAISGFIAEPGRESNVPEPGPFGLLLSALAAGILLAWRRRR